MVVNCKSLKCLTKLGFVQRCSSINRNVMFFKEFELLALHVTLFQINFMTSNEIILHLKGVNIYLDLMKLVMILNMKQIISTALIRENPVRRPIVPPIADNLSTNFAALSFVTLSKVGVSKNILTNLRSFLNGLTKRKQIYL